MPSILKDPVDDDPPLAQQRKVFRVVHLAIADMEYFVDVEVSVDVIRLWAHDAQLLLLFLPFQQIVIIIIIVLRNHIPYARYIVIEVDFSIDIYGFQYFINDLLVLLFL